MSDASGTWSPGPGPTTGDDHFVAAPDGATADALAGADTLIGGAGPDILIGNDGDDILDGQGGDDVLVPGAGADWITGGGGQRDLVSYADATAAVAITLQGASAFQLGGAAAGDFIAEVEGFIGSGFDDTMLAGSGDALLFGGDGADSLATFLSESNTLVGGSGADSLFTDATDATNTLVGGHFDSITGEVFDDLQPDLLFSLSPAGDVVFAGRGDTFYSPTPGTPSTVFVPAGYVRGDDITRTITLFGGSFDMSFEAWIDPSLLGSAPIYLHGHGSVQSYPGTVCFAAGTRIATARGEVPVETLRVGDLVVTAHGGAPLQPVVWMGHTRANVARHPDPARVAPVLISAGALADGVPARELRVSPEHAMFLDGHLVPARLLVNGTTIVQEMWCPAVTYWHVELPAHGLLVADGAVAESYFDDGNRKHFDNHPIAALFKDFASERGNGRYAAAACRPVLTDGPRLDGIRRRLAARAATRDLHRSA